MLLLCEHWAVGQFQKWLALTIAENGSHVKHLNIMVSNMITVEAVHFRYNLILVQRKTVFTMLFVHWPIYDCVVIYTGHCRSRKIPYSYSQLLPWCTRLHSWYFCLGSSLYNRSGFWCDISRHQKLDRKIIWKMTLTKLMGLKISLMHY